MNSSPPSTTERKISAPVRPVFNWIEVFAIPIAANIMETQPLVMLLFFIVVIFAGPGIPLPLGEIGVTLLLLGLQWWAMFINYLMQKGSSQRTVNILHILGVMIAFGLALLTNLTTFDLPMIVLTAGLVIFSWKRGIDKARYGLNDEQLIFVFKLGVAILLVALALNVLSSNGPFRDSSALLSYALPLFFLSGLIALSFTRVNVIRREHARQGIPQVDATRGWLVALTFLWAVLVIGALVLETFSFRTIQGLFLPLWNILAIIVFWIIYAVIWIFLAIDQILNSLFHSSLPPAKTAQVAAKSTPSAVNPLSHIEQFPAWMILLGRLLFVALVLLILFIIFRTILRHVRPRLKQDSEEEIREALSMRSILRERRQERTVQVQQKAGTLLDELDPDSMRARYRELLQQMAERDERLSRRPEETPLEYQKRLVVLLESSPNVPSQSDMESEREMLIDLTRAYINERYGEQQNKLPQHSDLPDRISSLADRLGKRGV